jgi:hypothetical protein
VISTCSKTGGGWRLLSRERQRDDASITHLALGHQKLEARVEMSPVSEVLNDFIALQTRQNLRVLRQKVRRCSVMERGERPVVKRIHKKRKDGDRNKGEEYATDQGPRPFILYPSRGKNGDRILDVNQRSLSFAFSIAVHIPVTLLLRRENERRIADGGMRYLLVQVLVDNRLDNPLYARQLPFCEQILTQPRLIRPGV